MFYEVTAGKELVSVDEILARYLWNQETVLSPSKLADDKWIRDANAVGRFVSAANFEFL
ncbi:hypothetical protein [Snodgrassella communis]|uniref:hypothetical protein n=1 Tax=Snodgrassella communis TaxID=2946699 RepID=UPI0015D5346E|nr:hypothetical protein [Snodgrassella communis]